VLTGIPLVALDTLGDHFEVKLTLSGDEVLAGVLVDLDLDRRVLLCDLLERLDELPAGRPCSVPRRIS